jgi:MFS superfamily sulfate permease-like transporter
MGTMQSTSYYIVAVVVAAVIGVSLIICLTHFIARQCKRTQQDPAPPQTPNSESRNNADETDNPRVAGIFIGHIIENNVYASQTSHPSILTSTTTTRDINVPEVTPRLTDLTPFENLEADAITDRRDPVEAVHVLSVAQLLTSLQQNEIFI